MRRGLYGLIAGVLLAAHGCAYEVSPENELEVDAVGGALDGEEVIEVMSCSPGYLQLGEGASMTCIADPSWANDPDSAPGGGLGEEFGGGGRGRPGKATPPKRTPPSKRGPAERSCKPQDLASPAAGACIEQLENDLMNNHLYTHRVVCYRDGTKACCQEPVEGAPPGFGPFCDPID